MCRPRRAGSCARGATHHRPRRHDLAEHGPWGQPHGHREPDDDQRPPRPRPAGRRAGGASAVALPSLPAASRRRPGCRGSCRWWEDDPDFDLARHLHVGELAAPGDDRALQEYIAGQLERPLRARPPALGGPRSAGVRRRVGRLLAAAPLAGRRDRAHQGAALADRCQPRRHPGRRRLARPTPPRVARRSAEAWSATWPRRVGCSRPRVRRSECGMRTTGVATKLLLASNPESSDLRAPRARASARCGATRCR